MSAEHSLDSIIRLCYWTNFNTKCNLSITQRESKHFFNTDEESLHTYVMRFVTKTYQFCTYPFQGFPVKTVSLKLRSVLIALCRCSLPLMSRWCNFRVSVDPFNDDAAFAETSKLSIGNSAVIYAVTHSFITGDRLVYLSPLKFSDNGSIRKPRRT